MQSNLEKLNLIILKMYEAKVRLVSNHIDWMSISQMIKWNWQQTNWFIFILFWVISNGSEATNFSYLLALHSSDPRPAPHSPMAWTWTLVNKKQEPHTSSVVLPWQWDFIIHFFSCPAESAPLPAVSYLLADTAGRSLASYYTSLGLFIVSVPGLCSLIKCLVKSKLPNCYVHFYSGLYQNAMQEACLAKFKKFYL